VKEQEGWKARPCEECNNCPECISQSPVNQLTTMVVSDIIELSSMTHGLHLSHLQSMDNYSRPSPPSYTFPILPVAYPGTHTPPYERKSQTHHIQTTNRSKSTTFLMALSIQHLPPLQIHFPQIRGVFAASGTKPARMWSPNCIARLRECAKSICNRRRGTHGDLGWLGLHSNFISIPIQIRDIPIPVLTPSCHQVTISFSQARHTITIQPP
jgi:hypothetical protein